MDCIGVIPARFASTRFPGKLLAPLAGRPLIEQVVEHAGRIDALGELLVATDDQRIAEAAQRAGAGVILSSDDFASGTDRVADAAASRPADVIVNIQGDELLLDASAVSDAIRRFHDAQIELGTLRTPLTAWHDLWDPNVVKVVIDDNERALYFSRAPVPFPRRAWQEAGGTAIGREQGTMAVDAGGQAPPQAWVHLGVYLYRPTALRRWAALPESALERSEGLEQLRVLEAGETMQTYRVDEAVPGVNTPADLQRVEAMLEARATGAETT